MKKKLFKISKYVVRLDPRIIAYASQKNGVIVATDQGMFKVEKIEWKNGHQATEIIKDGV